MRGYDSDSDGYLFQCCKFPNSDVLITASEINNTSNVGQYLLVYRGWSDLFTNIHADCVRSEVISNIKRGFAALRKELFPGSKLTELPLPNPSDLPKGLGFEYRTDWCHHCESYTVHSNQLHDHFTFHCTEKHAARPRFEN